MSVTYASEAAQGTVTAVPVASRPQVDDFLEVPYLLYRRDPHWVPPLRRDEIRRLSPRHNPFLAHAEIATWIARDEAGPCGRIAAIEDRAHNDFHHERVGWFGFFEAASARAATVLLSTAEQWARARGFTAMRGPVNPSLNESAGLLVDGFDDDPCLLMPFNPPQYAAFIEANGYRKAKDLLAWDIDLAVPLGARIERLAERVRRRRDITVRRVDMRAYFRDLEILNTIYRSAWDQNWGFVPPTDAEMRQLAVDLKAIVDPDLVLFAETNGRAIACVVALPDVNQVLKRMNGRLLPFGLLHFLRRRRIITRARVLLLGVVAEHRNIGVYPLLISEAHRRAVANGYTRAEMSWTLEDNHSVNAGIAASGGALYKRYRLYEKPLG